MGRLARVWGLAWLLSMAGMSCATSSSVPGSDSTSASHSGPTGVSASLPASASGAAETALPSASAARAKEAEAFRFADLVNDLSEPDVYFFSDNLISNETSYLQTAKELSRAPDPSGVYLGVGPEQNFSYIAMTRPSVAFVVDIRRANMLLHLVYRAAFEEAANRAEFLAVLMGRAKSPAATSLAATATVVEVMDAASKGEANEATFEAAHKALSGRVYGYGVKLSDDDKKSIKKMHRAFFDEQLGIRFELHSKNGRAYPSLRELMEAKSPDGATGSFLATDDAFKFVQGLQRAGRIVPLVGDFAGDKAIPELASYLKTEGRSVSVFYVSNVEQYLLEPKVWKKWARNVKALPKTKDAVFVRAYLDQGRKHPNQMKGHRTATVLAKVSDFETLFGDKPTATFWALCTERVFGG